MSPACLLSPEQGSSQATSCCLTRGWGHLPSVSLVPRMGHGGVTHLLPDLGMCLPVVSPVCPQHVPYPEDEPAVVATLLLHGLGMGMGLQHGVPNMSPVPRISHLSAATCLQPYLGTGTCPHCGVPNMSLVCPPVPGQAIDCSHLPPAWLRDEEVSPLHRPQCVPTVSPACPPALGEAPPGCCLTQGQVPPWCPPACPWHVPCPQDEPAAMTTHELPGSAVTFEVTGLAPGHTFELFIQAQREKHLGAPGTLRVRTRTCHLLSVGTTRGQAWGWGQHGDGSGCGHGDRVGMAQGWGRGQ